MKKLFVGLVLVVLLLTASNMICLAGACTFAFKDELKDPETEGLFTSPGNTVCMATIKAATELFTFTEDGCLPCYCAEGLGTESARVYEISTSGCHNISYIQWYHDEAPTSVSVTEFQKATPIFELLLLLTSLSCLLLLILYYKDKHNSCPNWDKLFTDIKCPRKMLAALISNTIVDLGYHTNCPNCQGGEIETRGLHLYKDTSEYIDDEYIDSEEEGLGYIGIVQIECENCGHQWEVDSNEHSVQDY